MIAKSMPVGSAVGELNPGTYKQGRTLARFAPAQVEARRCHRWWNQKTWRQLSQFELWLRQESVPVASLAA